MKKNIKLFKDIIELLNDIKPFVKKILALSENKKLGPAYKIDVYDRLINIQALLKLKIEPNKDK